MKHDESYQFDLNSVSQSFSEASQTYDQCAVFQREIADRLVERLDLFKIQPQRILDVGAGTGYCTRLLEKQYKKAKILGLDLSHGMLTQAKRQARWLTHSRFVRADAHKLPLLDHSVDFIFSNLAMHWFNDLAACLKEFKRVLKPNGLLLFSTLGPDTFKELRDSWARVDGDVHVNQFWDMHDVGDALMHAGFLDPVMDMEYVTLKYQRLNDFMKELKALGVVNAMKGRSKGLMGKSKLQVLHAEYETYRKNDRLPVTYEVVYGHAWGRDLETTSAADSDGVISIPITSIGRSS